MTEAELRQKVVSVMQGFIGCKVSNGTHKKIIDLYNAHKPLARGYTVKYTDAWCATTVSVASIQAGLTDIIPTECGCGQMIELFKKLGSWQESDYYRPLPGDIIFYDWQDTGSGDNKGWPDHVGIVEKVAGNIITAIEGNNSNSVARRNIAINGRYIRGYGVPKYSSKATKETVVNSSGLLSVGDTIIFIGSKQHISSYSGASEKSAKACTAKVTAISSGKAHPYHIVGVGVYGWVDAKDIDGVTSSSVIKVGDIVQYTGKVHYSSSYAGAKGTSCKSGEAKVTAINKNGSHVYHLKHTGKGCTVYGWVDAKDILK